MLPGLMTHVTVIRKPLHAAASKASLNVAGSDEEDEETSLLPPPCNDMIVSLVGCVVLRLNLWGSEGLRVLTPIIRAESCFLSVLQRRSFKHRAFGVEAGPLVTFHVCHCAGLWTSMLRFAWPVRTSSCLRMWKARRSRRLMLPGLMTHVTVIRKPLHDAACKGSLNVAGSDEETSLLPPP